MSNDSQFFRDAIHTLNNISYMRVLSHPPVFGVTLLSANEVVIPKEKTGRIVTASIPIELLTLSKYLDDKTHPVHDALGIASQLLIATQMNNSIVAPRQIADKSMSAAVARTLHAASSRVWNFRVSAATRKNTETLILGLIEGKSSNFLERVSLFNRITSGQLRPVNFFEKIRTFSTFYIILANAFKVLGVPESKLSANNLVEALLVSREKIEEAYKLDVAYHMVIAAMMAEVVHSIVNVIPEKTDGDNRTAQSVRIHVFHPTTEAILQLLDPTKHDETKQMLATLNDRIAKAIHSKAGKNL